MSAAQEGYNKILDVGEFTINNLLSVVPSAKVKLDRTLGNFFGYTEPTFKGQLEVAPEDVALAHAALAQAGLDMNQDAIHISQVKARLEAGENFGEEMADGSVYEPNMTSNSIRKSLMIRCVNWSKPCRKRPVWQASLCTLTEKE